MGTGSAGSAATRSIVGRGITVDARPREIIGVLPEGFRLSNAQADLFVPLRFDRSNLTLGNFSFQGVARLKPEVFAGPGEQRCPTDDRDLAEGVAGAAGLRRQPLRERAHRARTPPPQAGRRRRRGRRAVGADGHHRHRAAHRLRQRRQPAARACGGAPAGARDPRRARRRMGAPGQGTAAREPHARRARRRPGRRRGVRRPPAARLDPACEPAPPRRDHDRPCGLRLRADGLARVGTPLRHDSRSQARRPGHLEGPARRRPHGEPRQGTTPDQEHARRRTGGPRPDAARRLGADDSDVPGAAQRRAGLHRSRSHPDRPPHDPGGTSPGTRARDADAAGHPRPDRRAAGRVWCIIFQRGAARALQQQRRGLRGRQGVRRGTDPADSALQVRRAGLFRQRGHAARRGPRPDVDRSLRLPARGRDLGEPGARALERPVGRARQACPGIAGQSLARGGRCRGERPRRRRGQAAAVDACTCRRC